MSYVLIVDDDHMMAQTLSDMVGLFDWTTQVVTNPRAAIESLQRNPPALILLDLNMPGVDGLEVCRYIKRDPVAGHTPVVFVTAEDDPGTRERATAAGAMDYLVKPVDIDRLEQLLEKLPSNSAKGQPSTGKLSTAQPSSETASTATPIPSATPVIQPNAATQPGAPAEERPAPAPPAHADKSIESKPSQS